MTMPDQIFINIALLAVGVAIGALLGETSRQQHDRQLFREYINFMTESEHNNELLFREVIRFTRTSCRMAAHTLLAALTLRHRWIWTTHASIARLRARAGT